VNTAARIPEEQVKRAFARNAAVATLFETTWGLGMPFCLMYAVTPLYLLHLGTSKLLVQTVLVSVQLLTFLQLWSGRVCSGPRRLFKNALLYAAFALLWGTYGAVALLFWEALPVGLWIALFVVTALCNGVMIHLAGPVYGEVIIENIPKMRRGMVNTLRRIGLGSTGILGVLLTRRVMSHWDEPVNYHVRFMIGAGLLTVSCLTYLLMRDAAARGRSPQADRIPALQSLRALFGNLNFRAFLVFHMLVIAASSLMPLLLGYGRDVLELKVAEREFFIMASSIGMIAVGLSVPILADHFGFRTTAVINAALLLVAFAIPVIAGRSKGAAYVAYGLYGGSLGLSLMVLGNLGSELVPEVRPATIIAVGGTLAMPLSFCLAPVGGWLVDTYRQAGYLCVFVVGATLSFCAIVGFVLIVREPRTGQELYVRLRKY
jgi:hypothetical protein